MPQGHGGHRPSAGPAGPRSGRDRGVGEHRWPPALAALVAIGVYAFLPSTLQLAPKYLVAGVELAVLVALVVVNPVRMQRENGWSRWLSIVLDLLVIVLNLGSLVLLVTQLSSDADGGAMLLGAMQVWITGVIGFALLFWEVDRGGPVARAHEERSRLPLADWRFSQDENHDAVEEVKAGASVEVDWMPEFVDYLYLSLTNSSAFSPTDTMPLSSRAKMLMGLQATAALLTSLLVVARAVGSLTG